MSRLRVLVACLLMLVLPAQGFAAAWLALAAQPTGGHTMAARPAQQQHRAAGHEHGADSRHHHAGHGQAAAGHDCGTCGACHGTGIAGSWTRVAAARLPAPDLLEPLVRISTAPLPLPERPPRA